MTESAQNLYKCNPREAKEAIIDCVEAGLVCNVTSSPGAGKSSIFAQVAKEFDLELIDHRLSTSSPVDLSGLPDFIGDGELRRATFSPFDVFPTEHRKIPKGKNGWLLFLDEANAAPKSVQAASYKLILDKMVGQHRLHPNTAIGCAGNLTTDRAITNPMSTAMQSRMVNIEMEVDFQVWLEDVALKQGYDPKIIAYLSYMPNKLMDFRPDNTEKNFCCPRTWEFMNKLVKGKEVEDRKIKTYAGAITSGVAVEFLTFTKVFQHMPTIKQILSDPKNTPVPQDQPTRWAVVCHVMEMVTEENFEDVTDYVNRMPSDFRVLFFRSTLRRQPKLRHHPIFARAMSDLSRYFNGA